MQAASERVGRVTLGAPRSLRKFSLTALAACLAGLGGCARLSVSLESVRAAPGDQVGEALRILGSLRRGQSPSEVAADARVPLRLGVHFANTGSVRLVVDGLDYELTVAGQQVANGSWRGSLVLEAGEERTVEVPCNVLVAHLPAAALRLPGGIRFRLHGHADVRAGPCTRHVEFSATRVEPVLETN